jgi:DNA-binding CsgD family transcriptional regulator/tetratricopeptide (TPR) repeat protein
MNAEDPDIRQAEQQQLRRLLDAEPAARVLVVRGDAGLGKTTLLADLADHAAPAGWRVLRATGSISESALSLAGLHQLLRPIMAQADSLPHSQRSAIFTAFGLAVSGGPTDPLLLCLACLTLLSEESARQPLLLAVDDAQWIDQSTLNVLGFLSRRLAEDRVALAVATRAQVPAGFDLDCPVLELPPLSQRHAHQLLDRQPIPPLGSARAAVLEQATGNPLALVELARAVAADPAAARGWKAQSLPLTERLERSFTASARTLPADTQQALVLIAAAGDGDMNLTYLSGTLGLSEAVWAPAEAARLVQVTEGSLTFTHPLIRTAVYQAAPAAVRSAAHRALADALHDRPDRQAWQLAAAATGPDEAVAQRLESIAEQALQQGRYDTATAAWQRAAELTPSHQAAGALLAQAANAASGAGQVDLATSLARRVLELTDDPVIRGQARGTAGMSLIMTGQRHAQIVTLMSDLALELTAANPLSWGVACAAATAAYYSGEDALRARVLDMIGTLNGGPLSWATRPGEAVAVRVYKLWVGAALQPRTDRPAKLGALLDLSSTTAADVTLQLWLAAAALVLDEPRLTARLRDLAEQAPSLLSNGASLMILIIALTDVGRWDEALELSARARAIGSVYHEPMVGATAAVTSAYIAACRGDTQTAAADAASVLAMADPSSTSTLAVRAIHVTGMAAAMNDQHEEAFAQLSRLVTADGGPAHYREGIYGLMDLADAARRTGRGQEGARLVESAFDHIDGTLPPRLLQVRALCRALLTDEDHAEHYFLEALAVAGGEHLPFERARVELAYGQWLHREKRDKDARPHLNAAARAFRQLAATPWEEMAQREQRAAGVRLSGSPGDAMAGLSPSERQVVLLAAEGLTNPEIGARLFLSPRTVGSHLYRSFAKLGITSRHQLTAVIQAESGGPGMGGETGI